MAGDLDEIPRDCKVHASRPDNSITHIDASTPASRKTFVGNVSQVLLFCRSLISPGLFRVRGYSTNSLPFKPLPENITLCERISYSSMGSSKALFPPYLAGHFWYLLVARLILPVTFSGPTNVFHFSLSQGAWSISYHILSKAGSGTKRDSKFCCRSIPPCHF